MDEICVICQENLTPPTVYELDCRHRFHKDCLLRHFRLDGRCPLCRSEPTTGNAHIMIPLAPFFEASPQLDELRDELRHLKTELSIYRHVGWAISKWNYASMCGTHKLVYRMCQTARSIQFCYNHDTTRIESDDEIVEPDPFSEEPSL